jgi:hypothetical protein
MAKNVTKVPNPDKAPTEEQKAQAANLPETQDLNPADEDEATAAPKNVKTVQAPRRKTVDETKVQAAADAAANSEPVKAGAPKGGTPSLLECNRLAIEQKKIMRENEPLAGLERLIGLHGKKKLLRALPVDLAKANQDRMIAQPPSPNRVLR